MDSKHFCFIVFVLVQDIVNPPADFGGKGAGIQGNLSIASIGNNHFMVEQFDDINLTILRALFCNNCEAALLKTNILSMPKINETEIECF